MTSRFGKKEKLTLFTGLFLLLAFAVFIYFIFIQPLRTTIQNKQVELSNQQKLLEVIESRDIESSGELAESSIKLQKQVPVDPMLEQFIIDLEMAETVSNSQILSVNFSDEGAAGSETPITEPPPTQSVQPTEETQNKDTTSVIAKPEGIKEITLELSIESESYYDLEKFIDTLESLDRIVEVNSVSFTGPPEISSIGTGTNQIKTSFQLSLSIFYYPVLQDLIEELPELETESPANKSNPLSNFSDIPLEENTNN
jgi:type IV pilus assembly protein PilO